MSDTEILDQGETLVEPTPLSKETHDTGFDFEDIITYDSVRCIRCGCQFELSISKPPYDDELYSDRRIRVPIRNMEFTPYSCPHCGSEIVGIAYEVKGEVVWID